MKLILFEPFVMERVKSGNSPSAAKNFLKHLLNLQTRMGNVDENEILFMSDSFCLLNDENLKSLDIEERQFNPFTDIMSIVIGSNLSAVAEATGEEEVVRAESSMAQKESAAETAPATAEKEEVIRKPAAAAKVPGVVAKSAPVSDTMKAKTAPTTRRKKNTLNVSATDPITVTEDSSNIL